MTLGRHDVITERGVSVDFKNRIAVVTGGGSGIGKGVSLSLADKGAMVVIADLCEDNAMEVVDIITDKNQKSEFYKLDVSNSKDVEKFGEYLKEKYDNIDFLVNSAGISKITPFFDHSEELWDKTMDINLKGQFNCCKVAVDRMLENNKGSIINLSSQSGKVGTSNYQAYCASKFGVIGLTQSLAAEFGPRGIRVNSIAPGVIYTPMWDQQKIDYAKKRDLDPDHVMDYFKNKIPLRRLGTVEDVAQLVCFLLSDDSSYITGQTINLNGGDIMF